MNDKMIIEGIFTKCYETREEWRKTGEDKPYGAFCALYQLIEKWDLTEIYMAWKNAQKILANSPLTFTLNEWFEVEAHGTVMNGKIQLEFIAYPYQRREKIVKIFTYSNDTNFDLIDLTTITSPL